MRRITLLLTCLLMALSINAAGTNHFPRISEKAETGYFPLSQSAIYLDADDYKVVGITAGMLTDDVERVQGQDLQCSRQRALKESRMSLR